MIDIEKAKEEFIGYVDSFDLSNEGIVMKKEHSLRVMNEATNIAKSLNLSQEDIDLATLIGLLHDISRFEQMKQFNTFFDNMSFDHGDKGVEILKDNNYIRSFIETSEYDEIIYKAIANHNKFKIEDGLDEKTLLHCKIARDADKVDIMYILANSILERDRNAVENGRIADSAYNALMNKTCIKRDENTRELEEFLTCIGFIYDVNYDYSKKVIWDNKYIEQYLDKYDYKIDETKQRIENIKQVANEFLKDNTND